MSGLRRCVVTGGVILVAALQGCEGGGSALPASLPSPDLREIVTAQDFEFPVGSLLKNEVMRQRTINDAYDAVIEKCAQRFNVKYSASDTADTTSSALLGSDRRYGTVNREEVERWGYGFGGSGKADGRGDVSDHSARERRLRAVLYGVGNLELVDRNGGRVPEGGCEGEAIREVGTANEVRNLVWMILDQSLTRLATDPRAIEAQDAWVSCMDAHGFDFDHRWDAGNSVQRRPPAERLDMAVLDLDCAEATDYVETWHAVDVDIQTRLMAGIDTEIDRAEQADATTVARARKLLGRYGREPQGPFLPDELRTNRPARS